MVPPSTVRLKHAALKLQHRCNIEWERARVARCEPDHSFARKRCLVWRSLRRDRRMLPLAGTPSPAMPSLATLSLEALAEQSGVSSETIRDFERLGLLSRPRRTNLGLVLYPPEEVHRVAFVRRALDLGFASSAIRDMLGRRHKSPPTCRDIHALAERRLAEVRQRMAELALIERTLAPWIENCPGRGPVDACALITALSHPVVPAAAEPVAHGTMGSE